MYKLIAALPLLGLLPLSSAAPTPSPLTRRGWTDGNKIRGVNAGNLFVFEPWIDQDEWSRLGCSGQNSELDCGAALGRDAYSSAMQDHYASYFSDADFDQLAQYGINYIRVPVGFWMKEDLVEDGENFATGGYAALKTFAAKAKARNIRLQIDLHGAPGNQFNGQQYTGYGNDDVQFYTPDGDYRNFGRAVEFLAWMAGKVHTDAELSSVDSLELVNEPLHGDNTQTQALRQVFYPRAIDAVRQAEQDAGAAAPLTLVVMGQSWGAGDPAEALSASQRENLAFDNHRYIKWDTSVSPDPDAYLGASCADSVAADGEAATVVGEWSLSVADGHDGDEGFALDGDANKAWYRRWFAAQMQAYERASGWVYWTWKANSGDARWSFKDAVEQGLIPDSMDEAAGMQVC